MLRSDKKPKLEHNTASKNQSSPSDIDILQILKDQVLRDLAKLKSTNPDAYLEAAINICHIPSVQARLPEELSVPLEALEQIGDRKAWLKTLEDNREAQAERLKIMGENIFSSDSDIE